MVSAPIDYDWSAQEEPHATRKVQIMAKYGDQIRPLMRPEWRTVPIVCALVAAQLSLGVLLRDASWPVWIAVAWVVGGTINHALFLAIHEIVHGLAVSSLEGNKIVSYIANLGIGIPYAQTFHGYHMEHHKYQGWDGVDTDIPTRIEGRLVRGKVAKFLFCFFQILFYALRPCLIRKQSVGTWHIANWLFVAGTMCWYATTFGISAWVYLVASTFFAGALHPVSGHFISEHFEFTQGAETYSYYGPLNVLAFNVGYHNEHHDFPNIPWSRLPQVRKIAPEFYDNLPQTKSWPGTIWNFIMDDSVGAFSRVKRHPQRRRASVGPR
eukprot:TRINITY_DN10462_c0_g1_i1.p2 TRINITY_DN10462_c0_g1~~TRINITY_DN10462_c0_g1_i1.p2  ORF type:complete len:349 (+),score=123.10 TRINITY_DN10462_c0_g1_i1:78-1049(+)